MHIYEVEIKSLLGSKDKAQELKESLTKNNNLKFLSKGRQLNHYFNTPKDLDALYNVVLPYTPEEKILSLQKIIKEGKKVSVRTRESDGKVLFIIKASINEHSSDNGVSRIEFEIETKGLSLEQLDNLLLKAGLSYQAKWSREREEFQIENMHICIDRNAGYGYLAEFELVVDDESLVEQSRKQILDFMKGLGVLELPQDRLERMFGHYNKHWKEYYGADKTFVVE